MSFNLFIFGSRCDRLHQKKLVIHLATLRRQGIISVSTADERVAEARITAGLGKADVVVSLISAEFIASDLCHRIMKSALLTKDRKKAPHVIPVIVRAVDLEGTLFAKLQWLPPNGKTVRAWGDEDEFWVEVVKGIRCVLESLSSGPLVGHEDVLDI